MVAETGGRPEMAPPRPLGRGTRRSGGSAFARAARRRGRLRLSVRAGDGCGRGGRQAPRPAVWEEEVAPANCARRSRSSRSCARRSSSSTRRRDRRRGGAAAEPGSASFAAAAVGGERRGGAVHPTEAAAPALVRALRAAGGDAFDAISPNSLDAVVCEGTLAGKHAAARAAAAPAIVEVMRARRRRAGAGGGTVRSPTLAATRLGSVREAGGIAAVATAMRAFPKARCCSRWASSPTWQTPAAAARRRCSAQQAGGGGARDGRSRRDELGALATSPSPTSPSATPPQKAVCDAGGAAAVAAALDRWGTRRRRGGGGGRAQVGRGALRTWRRRPSAAGNRRGRDRRARAADARSEEDAELQRMALRGVLAFVERQAKARRSTPAPSRQPSARWRHTPPAFGAGGGRACHVQFVFGDRDGRAAALDAGARRARAARPRRGGPGRGARAAARLLRRAAEVGRRR